MSLAERLKSTGKMEVDPPQGKRQSETAQQGSPPKRRPEDPSAKTDEGRRTPKGRGRGRGKTTSGGQEAGELMRAMSALALRHEDSINTLQADLSFIVYLDTPGKTAASAIPALVQTQREHKQTSEGIPLRQKLLLALFSQLESQIQKVVADKDLIQAGVHDGLLKQEGSSEVHFVYQMWDATAAKQVPNDSVKPISTKEILQTLREIASLAGTQEASAGFRFRGLSPWTWQEARSVSKSSLGNSRLQISETASKV